MSHPPSADGTTVVTIAGKEYLTQKDLCYEWGVCLRTVQNERKRWKLEPQTYIGLMPLFTRDAVRRAERKRYEARRRR